MDAADLGDDLGLGHRGGVELGPDPAEDTRIEPEGAGLPQARHQPHQSVESRSIASNSSRSKFEEIWMSIDGEVVGWTPRTS